MFANLKAKLDEVSGEARADAEAALHDAEAELEKAAPLVTQFRSELTTLVKDTEPELRAAVTALTDKLASDLAGVIKL